MAALAAFMPAPLDALDKEEQMFGTFPIGSSVSALPHDALILEGNVRDSPIGFCLFTLRSERHQIDYVIEDGRLVRKWMMRGTGGKPPFGIDWTDTVEIVAAKLTQLAGTASRVETVHRDPEIRAIVESSEIIGQNGRYTVRVAFTKYRMGQILVWTT